MRWSPAILLLVLVLTSGCGILPSGKLESESAKTNPNPTIDDAELFLNMEPMGRISGLKEDSAPFSRTGPRSLAGALREITKQRDLNGVFIADTNTIAADVYLVPDPALTVGAVAKIYNAIEESAGSAMLPREPLREVDGPEGRPNPLILVVTTGAPREMPPGNPASDPRHRFTHNVTFEEVEEPERLRAIRVEGALEISADDRYFINLPREGERSLGTLPDQRQIDAESIRAEADNVRVKPAVVPVIVSGRTSYAALHRLLNSLEPATPFRVIIRSEPE